MDVFENHFMNPFNLEDRTGLYVISSGMKVPKEIADDILMIPVWGKESRDANIEERLLGKAEKEADRNIHKPISRCPLKRFESMNKSAKITSSAKKVIEYRESTGVLMNILVKSGNNISLQELCCYPLTVIPSCFGTPDGIFAKTNKAKGFKHLVKDVCDVPYTAYDNSLTIIDGNAIFHQLKDIPEDFEKISEKIFLQGVGEKKKVIFSTDS